MDCTYNVLFIFSTAQSISHERTSIYAHSHKRMVAELEFGIQCLESAPVNKLRQHYSLFFLIKTLL